MAAGSGDPMITMLKGAGFSVVRLPRTTLQPLLVLKKEDKKFIKLGHINDVFASSDPLPQVLADEPAVSLSGLRSGKTEISIGLNILNTALKAFGGGLTAGARLGATKSVEFQFDNVFMDSVDILPLANWISKASIIDNDVVEKFLDDDKICILLATLKTNSINVDAFNSSGQGVDLSIPEIKGIVGGSVKMENSSERKNRLTFSGEERLAFGFQALRLFFDKGKLTTFKKTNAGAGALELRNVDNISVTGTPQFEVPEGCFAAFEE